MSVCDNHTEAITDHNPSKFECKTSHQHIINSKTNPIIYILIEVTIVDKNQLGFIPGIQG